MFHTKFPHATILWIFSTSGVAIHTVTINMVVSELYGRSHLGMEFLPLLFARAPAPITTSSWSKFMYCDTLCVSHLWASTSLGKGAEQRRKHSEEDLGSWDAVPARPGTSAIHRK